MSAYLDLDDVCGGHPKAQKELDDLRAELEAVKAERDDAHARIKEMRKGEPAFGFRTERDMCDEYVTVCVEWHELPEIDKTRWTPLFYLAPTLPEGWKAVPRKLDESMLDAAARSGNEFDGGMDFDAALQHQWDAMLEAAPEPK